MEKCIFLGYPDGYKGWKFFNPLTKYIVISERADFDERYFPALKSHSQVISTVPHTVNSFLPAPTLITNDLDTKPLVPGPINEEEEEDRKSTRLNSSHMSISYAVFCLKKKKR